MIVPLIIGFIASRKSKDSCDDYFIEGRGMGSVAAFFTVLAVWLSAFAFLVSNGSFYVEGPVYLTAFAWNILFGYLYFVVGNRIWFLGKKFNYVTPFDFLGDFYNNEKVRIIVGLIVIIFKIFFVYFLLLCGSC